VRTAIVIAGDGPAGSALAACCAEAGLPVTLVGPTPQAPWPATYGAWTDELDQVSGLGGERLWRHRFDEPRVAFDRGPPQGAGRAFGLLDNEILREVLRDRLARAGGRVRSGTVVAVRVDAQGSVATMDDGERLPAALVVDATGHRPRLATPGTGREPGWQVAFGIVGRIRDPPVPPGGMSFMDWRQPPGADGATPSFLYAMDLGGGRAFVEETSLAARPALPVGVLQRRLARRLTAAGTAVVAVESVERVVFPMGVAVPPRPQPVLAFGAAAGMVHPATGFQVAAALRRAPAVAAALADALAPSDARPADVAARAWSAVWPADLLRQRDLHRYGLEVLLGLDAAATQRFFQTFFALPVADQRCYLSGADSARDLARVMLRVVRRLPPRLAWRVASGALGAQGLVLARAVSRTR
jgi:lycopene cyclase-like protein